MLKLRVYPGIRLMMNIGSEVTTHCVRNDFAKLKFGSSSLCLLVIKVIIILKPRANFMVNVMKSLELRNGLKHGQDEAIATDPDLKTLAL